MRKLTKEEKIALKPLSALTRKYAYYLLQNGDSLEVVIAKITPILSTENFLKDGVWKSRMLDKMKHRHFDNAAKWFLKKLQEPQPNMEQVLKEAEKCLTEFQKSIPKIKPTDSHEDMQCFHNMVNNVNDLKAFISYINGYKKRIKFFDKQAFDMLVEGKSWEEITNWIQELNHQEEIDSENRLFILQTLKHIKKLKNLGIMPTCDLLKIALDSKYSDDPELLQEQSLLVNDCYDDENFTNAAIGIKKLCYKFIQGSIETAGYFHPNLALFLFKGDWVSEHTFHLLLQAKESVFNNGMQAIIQCQINKIYSQVKEKTELSTEDKYIITLAKQYQCI